MYLEDRVEIENLNLTNLAQLITHHCDSHMYDMIV